MWYDGGESVGTTDMYEKTLELEENFQMGEVLQYTWSYSVQFGGSHDRILACDVIDLDMMHAVCVGELGINPTYLSIPPYMFGVRQSFRFFLPSFT